MMGRELPALKVVELPTTTPHVVTAVGELGPGGANHYFMVKEPDGALLHAVRFQYGPRNLPDSVPGVMEDDLLAILEARYSAFQAGPYACEENGRALEAVRAARQAAADRTSRRAAAGTLGTNLGT